MASTDIPNTFQAVSSEYADVDEATKLGLRQFVHLEGQVLSSVAVKTSLYGSRANQTQTNAIGQSLFFSAGGECVTFARHVAKVADHTACTHSQSGGYRQLSEPNRNCPHELG